MLTNIKSFKFLTLLLIFSVICIGDKIVFAKHHGNPHFEDSNLLLLSKISQETVDTHIQRAQNRIHEIENLITIPTCILRSLKCFLCVHKKLLDSANLEAYNDLISDIQNKNFKMEFHEIYFAIDNSINCLKKNKKLVIQKKLFRAFNDYLSYLGKFHPDSPCACQGICECPIPCSCVSDKA